MMHTAFSSVERLISQGQKVLFLMGPTASGKSTLAIEIAKRLPVDIISVDSAMVYKGMDIGTAKPALDVLQEFPHKLIDIRDPAEAYSVADFYRDARTEIELSLSKNRIPLLVGGTMLYFNALRQGLSQLPKADESIRQSLLKEAEIKGWPALHQRLEKIDPKAAAKIKPTDSQRIQRALEVYELTGKSLSSLWVPGMEALPYPIVSIAVAPKDRSILHQRIAERFKIMLEQGFIDEVKKLYQRGDLTEKMPSIRCVGYRQIWQYLNGEIELEQAIEKSIVATRQLAKRQFTWLRSWPDINWFDSDECELAKKCCLLLEQ
ncbi:MAG: tRNA ((37)-N6)-dimethylallyltransferase MiaA [Gammaproteobacteria bacterium]|jgi:tRNA dimethylallyltransferase|nr:tRNA ((37)-N6)-dimethylallyltransferase MiaA [Gammaproteobacteria bacterium]